MRQLFAEIQGGIRMIRFVRALMAVFAAAAVVAGCEGPGPPPPPPAGPDAPTAFAPGSQTPPFGVGDVEFEMRVVADVADQSVGDNVRVSRSEAAFDQITRIQADVFPPHPEEFWVKVTVQTNYDFPDHAVLVDTTVFVDEEEIHSFAYVGGDTLSSPEEYAFNLFEHVESVPETVLVHAKTELTLYKGADEETISVDSPPEAGPESKATVLSNSLRINFRS